MWLEALPSSSSNVTMSRLSCRRAQAAYGSRWLCSQRLPTRIRQLCMSWHRLGMTNDTTGSDPYRFGKLVYGRLSRRGTVVKLVQGACLRAYMPLLDVQA